MNVGSYTYEEFLQKVREFHGGLAPGVILGGMIVDTAKRNLPADCLFDAICETDKCLPDSIQMLTPCTIGNGWMRIINTGRFAVTLYDKHKGNGVRVFVDVSKVKEFKDMDNWFSCLIPKKEQNKERLLDSIRDHGYDVLGLQHVKVDIGSLPNKEIADYAICKKCHESCLPTGSGVCLACQGKTYTSPANEGCCCCTKSN
ncbi:MAG: formylmethanofuran dehydrogenase subunit E family protein [Dehalococcoidia bacterium]|nr:formylmethanofuran dehydrogenase subunit E family protein [Dehalococcoidia bacterium]